MKKKYDLKLLWLLFKSTLYISAVTFGGGYVILSILKKKFSDDLKLIDSDEVINLIAIGQSAPGAVAINSSIILGYKVAGLLGAFVCTLGTVIPPFLAMSLLSFFYTSIKDNNIIRIFLKAMQAGVSAIILDVVINFIAVIIKDKEIFSIVIFILSFIAAQFLNINIMYIIFICGIVGYFRYVQTRRKLG